MNQEQESIDKYLKYKHKYLKLKKQLGGEYDEDNCPTSCPEYNKMFCPPPLERKGTDAAMMPISGRQGTRQQPQYKTETQ